MNFKNRNLLIALIIPILCLFLLSIYKAIKVSIGKEIVIPITGYDPRDLLSGHYLIYRLDLNNENLCKDTEKNNTIIYLCLNQNIDNTVNSAKIPGYKVDQKRSSCDAILKGKCMKNRFLAGVERFYIPEEYSKKLDKVIRDSKGKLVVSIDRNGNAVIKDLWINDKPWREYLQ
jgi:uncharacterized membrane-anchored protein